MLILLIHRWMTVTVVLSKGHAGPVWYSALAERGYFPKEWLMTLNDGGTTLPSHPDRTKTPGVDMTTGSLGRPNEPVVISTPGVFVLSGCEGRVVPPSFRVINHSLGK